MQKSKTQFDVFEGNKDTNIILFPLLKELTVDIDEENWDSQSLYTFLNTPQTFCFVINKAVNPVGFALIRLAHDEAEIIEVYKGTYGIEKYTKEEFINKITMPLTSLKTLEVIDTQRQNGKIIKMRVAQQ